MVYVQYFTKSCINIGAICLSDGSQLCLDGYWGSVYSTEWNKQDFHLLTCRLVEYHPKGDEMFGLGLFS